MDINLNENEEIVKDNRPMNFITRKIGTTTYIVRVHFCENSNETVEEKIKKLILEEANKK